MNFSTASSTTIPHPAEGAALLCGRLPPSFSVSPFRPGNLGLFGALLQPPAPEKKSGKPSRKNEILRSESGASLLFVDGYVSVSVLDYSLGTSQFIDNLSEIIND